MTNSIHVESFREVGLVLTKHEQTDEDLKLWIRDVAKDHKALVLMMLGSLLTNVFAIWRLAQ